MTAWGREGPQVQRRADFIRGRRAWWGEQSLPLRTRDVPGCPPETEESLAEFFLIQVRTSPRALWTSCSSDKGGEASLGFKGRAGEAGREGGRAGFGRGRREAGSEPSRRARARDREQSRCWVLGPRPPASPAAGSRAPPWKLPRWDAAQPPFPLTSQCLLGRGVRGAATRPSRAPPRRTPNSPECGNVSSRIGILHPGPSFLLSKRNFCSWLSLVHLERTGPKRMSKSSRGQMAF